VSYLALTDDELALLRFTCDLFFVEESPLFALDAEAKEPSDYATAYHALVERGIIDPHGFRITDDSLNRIAPVTECDARVSHIVTRSDGEAPTQTDHWLLDEIAVTYGVVGGRHLFGEDLDQGELIESFARHLVPRRSGGERLDVVATPLEFLALTLLLDHARKTSARDLSITDAKGIFKKPPPEDQRPPTTLLPPGRRGMARARSGAIVDDPAWDDALRSLVEKGVLRVIGARLWMHPSLVDLATRELGERHTVVRTDFGEEDWFVREHTFIPVEGSLFALGPRSMNGRSGIGIEELDGERLRKALVTAVGPLARDRAVPQAQKLADLLVRNDPVKA
jgi:hypothetical protein